MLFTKHSLAAKFSAVFLSLVLALTCFGCVRQTEAPRELDTPVNEQEIATAVSFEELCDGLFTYEVTGDNLTLNQLVANPESLGIETPRPATLGDFSPEGLQEDHDVYSAALKALTDEGGIDRATLTESQQIEAEYLEKKLNLALEFEKYTYYTEPFSPSMGWHAMLPLSFMDYNFRTIEDIEIYLELLEDLPRVLDQLIAFEQEKQAQQLLQSYESMEKTIEEARAYTGSVNSHVLVASFDEMIDAAYASVPDADTVDPAEGVSTLSSDELEAYKQRNRDAVEAYVIPTYQNLVEQLEQILPSCSEGTRLSDYPDGAGYYNLSLLDMGFAEDATSAAAVLDAALSEYWGIVESSSTDVFWYVSIPETVLQTLGENPEDYVSFLQEHASAEFADLGVIEYSIKKAPEASPNDYASAYFRVPPVDDPQLNTIVYFPRNISDYGWFYSTMAHEAYPGHMYQYFARNQENPTNVSKIMASTAYTEGWAVYVEASALRYLDADANAKEAYIAYNRFLRVLDARIEIGVNYEGWGIEEIDAYLVDWGYPSGLAQEWYDRCTSNPMSSIPYGLGVVKFDQLRQQSELQAGEVFDPIAYHEKAMAIGPVSFDILERELLAGQH